MIFNLSEQRELSEVEDVMRKGGTLNDLKPATKDYMQDFIKLKNGKIDSVWNMQKHHIMPKETKVLKDLFKA
jgi:hypothetical protein